MWRSSGRTRRTTSTAIRLVAVCPCCYGVHDDNNFFFRVVDDMEINMKNHSESCESRVMDSYKVMKYLFDCPSVSGRRLTSVSRQRTRGKQDQKSV